MLGVWKTWLQIICLILCSKEGNENYISRNLTASQGTQVPSRIPAVPQLSLTPEGLVIIQLKFSTNIRISMRKNGDISVPRWPVGLKRLPQKEEKTGSLQAWQQCTTPAQGLKVLVQAQLQKGPAWKRWSPQSCALNMLTWLQQSAYTLVINMMLVFHCQKPQRKCDEALHAMSTPLPVWRWVEKLKSHTLNSQHFCTILFSLLTFFHAGSFCSRQLPLQGPAQSTNPLSVLCGAQGTNPSRLSGIYFALLCSLGWRHQQQLYSIRVSGLETLCARPWCSKAGHSALTGLSNICCTDHLEAGKKGPPSRMHRTMCQAGTPAMMTCREHVGQLLGLDSACCQDLREIWIPHSGFAALISLFPLKLSPKTFIPNVDKGKYQAVQNGGDASPILFQWGASPSWREFESPFATRTLCQLGYQLLPLEGELVLPNSYFA